MTAALCAPAYAAPLQGEFQGSASSLSLSVAAGGVDIAVHNAAHVGCPCRGTHGNTRERTLSNLAVGLGGSIAQATTSEATSTADKTASTAQTAQTDTVAKLNLLGGLITADALTAAASASATPDALSVSDKGTTLTNLVIAGHAIDPNVPDNTSVKLPGIGSVTVKATESHTGKREARISLDALLVDVTVTNALLPVGAKLVVARAEAGFKRTQPPAELGGSAIAARIRGDAGNPLEEGAGAGSGVGLAKCSGTDGKTQTRSVSGISLPGLLAVSAATETAFGGPVGAAQVAKTSSTLSGVSLAAGLVTAQTVVAVAQESRTGDVSTPSAAGSEIASLAVAGAPVTVTAPNTKVTVPGLGYVVANEQIARGKNGLVVNGLHLVVTTANLLGLPVGAEIELAHADAAAAKF